MIFNREIIQRNLSKVTSVLKNEVPALRPQDSSGNPGGVIVLKEGITSIIVPDLHGRFEFLPDLLNFNYRGKTVVQHLEENRVQIICVGDGMHGESRVAGRWRRAYIEYQGDFQHCPEMQDEMYENFKTMSHVMALKIKFPGNFHFLKGNHENINDQNGNGDHSFTKFAAESRMTRSFVQKYFGIDFLSQYASFESQLPLLAKGRDYIITHSRPREEYSFDAIVNYHKHPDVIEGLTWTRNSQAKTGIVKGMLNSFLGSDQDRTYWISGHTPITGLYKLIEHESLILIHNPKYRPVVIWDPETVFDPEKQIVLIPKT